jgi:hypothetical protein
VIVAPPAAIPVTTPLAVPIVATLMSLLIQLPPVVDSVNVVFSPAHTANTPPMASGSSLTVTIAIDWHPVERV